MNYPYFNPYLQQQNQQAQQSYLSQQSQNINWVSGEAGAKSWLVGANSTVLLLDSEKPVFYLKSADNSGMPLPLRIFDYTERPTQQNIPQNTAQTTQNEPENLDDKYVTREEYKAMEEQYKKFQEQYKCIIDKLNSFRTNDSISHDGKRAEETTNKSRVKGGNSNG